MQVRPAQIATEKVQSQTTPLQLKVQMVVLIIEPFFNVLLTGCVMTICNGNGACSPTGKCTCYYPYLGTTCSSCRTNYYGYPKCLCMFYIMNFIYNNNINQIAPGMRLAKAEDPAQQVVHAPVSQGTIVPPTAALVPIPVLIPTKIACSVWTRGLTSLLDAPLAPTPSLTLNPIAQPV